jgi:SIR2-like domain
VPDGFLDSLCSKPGIETMLNSEDPGTFLAIRELTKSIRESKKPLVFWVGAGASKWLDYPLWKDLALDLRREFFKHVSGFDNDRALKLIGSNRFPAFFQQCLELDRPRYLQFLSNAFLPRPVTPLYQRFTDSLSEIAPLHILTTNIDESLEQRLPTVGIFQRSDISGCLQQLQIGKPFIAKLHGSRSSIESTVFTQEDYERLRIDTAYINALKTVFTVANVVFLGYSIGDQYVIDLLSDNARDMSLFGAGPHFVVSSDFKGGPPLRQISYSLKRFADHRSAVRVLDVIRQVQSRKAELSSRVHVEASPETGQSPETAPCPSDKTAYYISDLLMPGTWNSSVTAQLEAKDGTRRQMTVGLGFTNEELPLQPSTAHHDVVVGLICFDFIYFSLADIGKVHVLLGPDVFWQAINADIVRFTHLLHEPAIMSMEGSVFGDIGLVSISDITGAVEPSGALIRRQIVPAPGNESIAEKLFSELEGRVRVFGEGDNMELASLVRTSLMMPDVARLLGIGEAILPSQVPQWLTFPYLRMAHLVHTGAVCSRLGIQSAHIPFGGTVLTSAAFGVQSASESADSYASYVLSGRFDSEMGVALAEQSVIFQAILHFRKTAEGEAFRGEIRDQLLTNAAREFSASVNAGLKRNIPVGVLQKAKDKLSSLLTANIKISPVPAVWTNALQSDNSTRLWRAKSRRALLELAKQRNLRGDDPCICDSGDKLRLCCLLPLRD